jgi:hypothetical protein
MPFKSNGIRTALIYADTGIIPTPVVTPENGVTDGLLLDQTQ